MLERGRHPQGQPDRQCQDRDSEERRSDDADERYNLAVIGCAGSQPEEHPWEDDPFQYDVSDGQQDHLA